MKYPLFTLAAAFIGGCLLCAIGFAGDTPAQKPPVAPPAPTVTKAPPVTPSATKTPQQTRKLPTPQQTTTTGKPTKQTPQQTTNIDSYGGGEPMGLFARIRARREARRREMTQSNNGVEIRAPFTRINVRR